MWKEGGRLARDLQPKEQMVVSSLSFLFGSYILDFALNKTAT